MSERIYSTRDNQSVISSLVTHRLEQGLRPSARDMQRLQDVQRAVERRAAKAAAADLAQQKRNLSSRLSLPQGHPNVPGAQGASAGAAAASPPPGCPMHKSDEAGPSKPAGSSSKAAPSSFAAVSGKSMASGTPSTSGGGCPVPHDQRDKMMAEKGNDQLNPLNNMPFLSQKALSAAQQSTLSTERVVSSIPRSAVSAAPGASPYDAPAAPGSCPVAHDGKGKGKEAEAQESNWEYPSPQQFYNALVRKGWETPEESVEMMVLIHNFLNERAWQEVIEWEKLAGTDVSRLQLARFQGRPGTLSPKARLQGILARIMPNSYSSEPPFDRHDWIVQRPVTAAGAAATGADGKAQPPTEEQLKQGQVRYVIDYYEAPSDPDVDEAVFNLDVRPALDSLEAVRLRARKTFQEWGSSQEQPQQQAQTA